MRCSTVVIAHGDSEEIMARNIASRMRSDVQVYRSTGGAIRLEQLEGVLRDEPFVSEKTLHDAFPGLEFSCRSGRSIPDLRIIPIMDRESISKHWKSYLTGDMFRDSPLRDSITPVLNVEDLDDIMEMCGYGEVTDKARYYRRIFSRIDVEDFYNRLSRCPRTNLDEFVFHLMEHSPPHQGRIANGNIQKPGDRREFIKGLTRCHFDR